MTTYTNLSIIGVAITATTGSVLGAIVVYGIGMMIEEKRMEKMVERWGHFIRVTKGDIHRADVWFTKYGYWTVLFCRMIPLIRSLISIPAGMSRMTFWLFLLFTMIGTVAWNVILVLIGVALGESWQEILGFMEIYSTIVYLFIGIACIILVILFIRKFKSGK